MPRSLLTAPLLAGVSLLALPVLALGGKVGNIPMPS